MIIFIACFICSLKQKQSLQNNRKGSPQAAKDLRSVKNFLNY